EVADDRDLDAPGAQTVYDVGDRPRRLFVVDRHPHDLTSRSPERGDLADRAFDVGGIGVRHRLHDDRMRGSYLDAADIDDDGLAPNRRGGVRAVSVQATRKSCGVLSLRMVKSSADAAGYKVVGGEGVDSRPTRFGFAE